MHDAWEIWVLGGCHMLNRFPLYLKMGGVGLESRNCEEAIEKDPGRNFPVADSRKIPLYLPVTLVSFLYMVMSRYLQSPWNILLVPGVRGGTEL